MAVLLPALLNGVVLFVVFVFSGVLPPSGEPVGNAQLVTPCARFQLELSRFVCVCGGSVLLDGVVLFVAFAFFCLVLSGRNAHLVSPRASWQGCPFLSVCCFGAPDVLYKRSCPFRGFCFLRVSTMGRMRG